MRRGALDLPRQRLRRELRLARAGLLINCENRRAQPGPPSLTQFGLPDLPDSLELALDAAAGQAQPFGDLFIAMAFELALGNRAQAIVVERTHQTLIFFHRNRQHFRRRGIAQDFVEPRSPAIAVACVEHGFAADPAAATLSLLEQA